MFGSIEFVAVVVRGNERKNERKALERKVLFCFCKTRLLRNRGGKGRGTGRVRSDTRKKLLSQRVGQKIEEADEGEKKKKEAEQM